MAARSRARPKAEAVAFFWSIEGVYAMLLSCLAALTWCSEDAPSIPSPVASTCSTISCGCSRTVFWCDAARQNSRGAHFLLGCSGAGA